MRLDDCVEIWYNIAMSTTSNIKCDLHIHSTRSDGVYTPAELVNLAAQRGLECIAITDHDTFDGVAEAAAQAATLGLRYVVGAELSCVDKCEVHILAYNVDQTSPEMHAALARIAGLRDQRNVAIVDKLRQHGVEIDLDALRKRGSVGRAVIAREMVRLGKCDSVADAFERYLGTGKCCYVQTERLTPQQAISFTLAFGGTPVLAHPKLLHMDSDEFDRYLRGLKSCGLMGIEAHYFTHNNIERRYYCKMAAKYKLITTGGSDFHDVTHGVELGSSWFFPDEPARRILKI